MYKSSTKYVDTQELERVFFSEITNVTIQQKMKIECQDGASLSSCPEKEGGKHWESIRDTADNVLDCLPLSA